MSHLSLTFGLFFLFVAAPSWSARPFVTDDARLTTAGSCQLETWSRAYKASTEFWMLPACNPSGNLEITFGGGRATYADSSTNSNSDYVFQAKTLLKKLDTNGLGYGFAVGTVLHPAINPGPNLLGNTYVYAPVSISFNDDKFIIHTNIGYMKENGTNKNIATWGIGSELNVSDRVTWMIESYGDNRFNTYWQAGGRFSLIPRLLQIDSTTGRGISNVNASQWISFGIRYTPASLF